jgi:L-ascorbate metabolism protein UlaG (beta-lactamase superfamily)
MTRSDHFDGRKFFNPRISGDKTLGDLFRWMTSGLRKKWPKHVENQYKPRLPTEIPAGEAALTFINHSTFLVQFPGMNLLTDPVFSERASPFSWVGPKRVRAPGLPFEDLPPIQVVLVSHNHYDHMDMPSLKKLAARFDPLFITPLNNGRFLSRHGIRKVLELDWWQSHNFDATTSIIATPAQHFSSRTPFDRNRALWSGFVIQRDQTRVYFAGDSGYERHFKEIRQKLGPLDVALLPIGAYEPRWFMQSVHLNPEEAVKAHLDLGSPQTIAMHFGTFQLTDEGIDEPLQALEKSLQAHEVNPGRFKILEFGETFISRKRDRE